MVKQDFGSDRSIPLLPTHARVPLFRTQIAMFGLGSREDGFEFPTTLTNSNCGTELSFERAIQNGSTTFHFRDTWAKKTGFFGTAKKWQRTRFSKNLNGPFLARFWTLAPKR